MKVFYLLALILAASQPAVAAPAFEKSQEAQRKIECRIDKKSGSVVFSATRGTLNYKPDRSRIRLENCYEVAPRKELRTGRVFLVIEYGAETEFASRPGESLFYEIVWVDAKGRPHGVLVEDVSKFPVEVEWGEHPSDKLPMLRFLSRDKAGKVKGEMFYKFDPAAEDPVFKAVLESSKPLG